MFVINGKAQNYIPIVYTLNTVQKESLCTTVNHALYLMFIILLGFFHCCWTVEVQLAKQHGPIILSRAVSSSKCQTLFVMPHRPSPSLQRLHVWACISSISRFWVSKLLQAGQKKHESGWVHQASERHVHVYRISQTSCATDHTNITVWCSWKSSIT